MGRYDDRGTFRVVFTDTRDMNNQFAMNRGTPEEQKPILVSFRGRARYESDGTRWRAEYDSMMPDLRLDPAVARSMVDRVRRRRRMTGRSRTINSSSASPPSPPGSGPLERSSGRGARSSSGCWRGRIATESSIAITQRVVDGIAMLRRREQDAGWRVGRRDHHLPEARLSPDREEMDSSRQDLFLPQPARRP